MAIIITKPSTIDKFEHGFLSGFVSSLSGSYLKGARIKLTAVEKIAMTYEIF